VSAFKNALRYVATLPGDVFFAWPLVLFIRAAWGASLVWREGSLVVTLREGSWPMRTWYREWGGTTFGHGVMLASGQPPSVLMHELVHVEQIEANAIVGFLFFGLLVCFGGWWLGLILWPLTPALAYGAASLVAWMRSEPNAYKGNHLEEAAYAIAGGRCQ
jgi:hypothetical protein